MSKSSPKSLKVTKAPKSCTHPTRGLMVDFKRPKFVTELLKTTFLCCVLKYVPMV